MLKTIVNGVEKDIIRIPMIVNDTEKEGWEVRDQHDKLLWYRENTLTGVSSISYRGYGIPLKSVKVVSNSQQSGTPAPDAPIMPQFVGERTKNLLDNQMQSHVESLGVDFNKNPDGSVYANGEVIARSANCVIMGDGAANNDLEGYTTPIFKAGDQIIFSTGVPTISLHLRHTDGTYGAPGNETPVTLVEDVGLVYIRIGVGDIVDNTIYPMVRRSDVSDNTYEPYGYKLPLVNNAAPYTIYLGMQQTTRKIKKHVLTGNESWYAYEAANVLQFYTSGLNLGGEVGSSSLSNIAPYGATVSTRASYEYGCYIVGNGYDIAFQMHGSASSFADVNTWKTYLQQQYAAGTPIIFWYVLAEPETSIVNEPLMKIGNATDEVTVSTPITTAIGSNTLTVDTTLSPSAISITGHVKATS